MNPAGADSSHGGENSPCPQQPHRNMVLRAHHWGPSGHSAPDREAPRVCRYFQRGFCFRGDRCSYWHLVPTSPLEWGRRYSEPLVTRPGPWPGLTRRASEPTFPPSVVVDWGQGWLGARWGMELGLEEAGGSSWRSLSSSSAAWEPSLAQEPQPGSDPVGELSGALQSLDLAEGRGDSRDVVCGICRERVWEKPAAERAFGILPNCSHAHCLRCLRTWRRTPRLPLDVIKACPQCRVYSSYIIPYKFWVSEGPEKEQLIRTFTARTRQIQCRFFMRGNGRCPFRSNCIYLHQLPEQALASGPPWPGSLQLAPSSEVLVPVLFLGATRPEEHVSFPGPVLVPWDSEFLLDHGSS